MSAPYSALPNEPTISVKPFKAAVPQSAIDDLKRRLNDAPVARKTYENNHTTEQLGVTWSWMKDAVDQWKVFDWRKVEDSINSYANYSAKLDHAGDEFDVHFVGLFSEKKDATPVIMTHGWPGSFLEFLPLLNHLKKIYTPETLPVHIIVPSLIGYGFSSPPPLDANFSTADNAALFDKLMVGLGLTPYIAQGGDIGSFVSRFLAERYDDCKAIHLNFIPGEPPKNFDLATSDLDDFDKKAVERFQYFQRWEFAYAHEHATKSATIAMVCESSPIALLAWIGEKFIVWTDETPDIPTILSDVTLYYLTNSFPTGLYHYRTSRGKEVKEEQKCPDVKSKPVGYSQFAKEIIPTPKSWLGGTNVVWHRRHEEGGHFAALEKPETLWDDVHSFIQSL